MGTYARIEISQDADTAGQKVKWYKRLWEAYFNYLFSQVFIHVNNLQSFLFSPL